MKKLLFSLVFLATAIVSQAQIDIKITPIEFLWLSPNVGIEYAPIENLGVEFGAGLRNSGVSFDDLGFKKTGYSLYLAGKYYIAPQSSADGFGIGLFLKSKDLDYTAKAEEDQTENFSNKAIGFGVLATYKHVINDHILIGFDGGIGRYVSNRFTYADIDKATINAAALPLINTAIVLRLSMGYRF